MAIIVGIGIAALGGLLVLDSQWRIGIIVSAIAAVIALSVVVLTGFVGQVSLATYALAGLAAFAMVRFSDDVGVPFPFALLLGALAAVGVSIIIGFAVVMVRRSGSGRRWLAVRANERAAASAGVPVARIRLEAFAVAGFLAGIGGTLLAYRRELVTTSSFGVLDSVVVLAITHLAGVASPLGALLAGALAAGGLLTVALEEISPGSTEGQLAVNGILLVIVAIRFSSGILGARRSK